MDLGFFIKIVAYSIFALICFSQCYTILSEFFRYPITINVYDVSPSLITILPGLTICNNNRISLRKVANLNPRISSVMEERYPGWSKQAPSFLDRREFNNFRDDVSRILDRFANNLTSVVAQTPLWRMFDLKPDNDQFIRRFECARTWLNSIDCGALTRIDSIQDRRCVTVLHKGSMHYDLTNRPQLFNSTQTYARSANHSYFHAKEVIKILIDFEPEDYADLKRQIGARVMFHDSSFVASTNNLDFFVTRGHKYDFNIDRKDIDLSQDLKSNCLDYEEHLGMYESKIDPRVPLTTDTCFQNCLVINVINYSNCWPPTVPYFRNESLDPSNSLKACDWFVGIHQIPLVLSGGNAANTSLPGVNDHLITKTRMRTYKRIRRFCYTQCALACKFSGYSITVTRSPWPTDASLLFDKEGDKMRLLRHCCALITVKYAHFHYSTHEHKLKYDWTDTLGNIGGLLAVWLGISIVSIYRGVQKLIHLLTERESSARIEIKS